MFWPSVIFLVLGSLGFLTVGVPTGPSSLGMPLIFAAVGVFLGGLLAHVAGLRRVREPSSGLTAPEAKKSVEA